MKRTIFLTLCAIPVLASSSIAQAPESKDEQQLLQLVKELQAQQAQITDNHTKIAAKLADVEEAVRVARIYGSRQK